MLVNDALPPDTLVAFVDETGNENLSDPAHPVFGLGGCCALARDYDHQIVEPWRRTKAVVWRDPNALTHATGARLSSRQAERVAQFFRTADFHRVACMLKPSTRIEAHGMMTRYEMAAGGLVACVMTIAERIGVRSVALVFEASGRGDRLARSFMGRARLNHGPIPWTLVSKSAGEAGLQIADFVMHAAGRHVRAHVNGGQHQGRDFVAVFNELSEFREMESVTLQRNSRGSKPGIWLPHRSEPVPDDER